MSKERFTVEILRSGQPRAYADTENEYLITVETEGWATRTLAPGFRGGNLDELIGREESARKAGRMFGGYSPAEHRKMRREWALKVVRGLCQDFRERGDDDGRTGMDAHFYPTLKRLDIDEKAGTIRALIVEAYTD